jgi:putative two-component system response regulator
VADVNPPRLLVVEHHPSAAALLEQLLLRAGYQVQTVGDGVAALDQVRTAPPDLILLDLDLPYVDGYEVCRQLKGDPATRWIPIVIITGQIAPDAKLRAWDLGADDFLPKPFQCVEVVARCRSLLRVKSLLDDLDSAEAVVFAFARAVEAKSPYTQGHAERVTDYALALAAAVDLPASEREVLRKGALLHDIGKISIPDAVLDKPGRLTAEEFDLVKQHTIQGARIVEPLRSIRDTVPLIRWHHERLDGAGYPDGLSGDHIPRVVRILSVADVYDSLASARPYRSALPPDRCLEILRVNAEEGGLDPELVRVLSTAVILSPPTQSSIDVVEIDPSDSVLLDGTMRVR